MHNATAWVPAERAPARAFTEELMAFASRAHGERLGRQDQGLGARWQLTERSPVRVLVKAEHVFVSRAVGSQELCMAFCCKGIDHRSELLVGQELQVEGQVCRTSDGEVGPDTATMLSERCNEKTHRTSIIVTLIGPLAPGSSTTRGARLHIRHNER